jgi:hypothetical protein
VLANVVVVLAAFTLSLFLVVQQLLQVPIAGSVPLLLAGTAIYLAAAATNDVFLCPVFICPVARSMAQFAFLVIMAVIPIIMLSRGMGAVESKSYQWPLQLTCAQVREVMETMATGSFAKKFQALQQASTISS